MLIQFLIGSLLICLTVIVEVFFIGMATQFVTRNAAWLKDGHRIWRFMVELVAVVFWLLISLVIGMWLWALTFLFLDIFQTLEKSLYFSIVSFTTLGFGDIIIGQKWRLLSGFSAANGLIMFSLTTAFLIEFISRLHLDYQRGYDADDD
ncbi:potassium channel family protein [Alterisphingorhabdus coralli]|uniref:Potassium channel family protein n=1 Tax=Alterisphingorhabdus coralli TaxID=3071408 RepID=A0AA97F4I0_9SPHN|nr:potassium channel family protein [Parasphingorhabdus sp. SCSIO 66989]WOE73888.1 potassium channel family protein [Parasphingorhabdus sp. SCSIO 66989]